jgi:hypothetical protein
MRSSALAGSMARGEWAGREDASPRAAWPPARKRPSHFLAVGEREDAFEAAVKRPTLSEEVKAEALKWLKGSARRLSMLRICVSIWGQVRLRLKALQAPK